MNGAIDPIAEQAGILPFAHTVDLIDTSADVLFVEIFARSGGWIFLSEVEFENTTPPLLMTPLPGAGLLLATALAGIALRRRRKT